MDLDLTQAVPGAGSGHLSADTGDKRLRDAGGPVVTPVSHAVFALAAVALLAFEARSLRRRAGVPAAEAAEPVVSPAS